MKYLAFRAGRASGRASAWASAWVDQTRSSLACISFVPSFLLDTPSIPPTSEPFLWAFQAGIFQASIGMGTRRVRSAVQVSFNVAQGSVREPHRECAEEEDTPPSSSLLSSWPALGEERGQLTASSPFPLPSRPFVVRPERSCGRSKAAVPTSILFLFCCTRLMGCC